MIREYELNDIERIVELERELIFVTLGHDYYLSNKENSMFRVYVYVIDDIVCGYVSSMYDGYTLEILNICVDKMYQRQGIGSMLMSYLFDSLDNPYNAVLEVRESNVGAINTYTKLGFRVIHKRRGYYSNGEDAMMMEKVF